MQKIEELLKQLRSDPTNNGLKQQLQDWLRNNPDNDQAQRLWEEHWHKVDTDLPEKDYHRLDELLEMIHIRANIKPEQSNKSTAKYKRARYSLIAASLLLPLFILTGIHYYKRMNDLSGLNQLIVQESQTETKHFFLPDSTEVWLNSASRLNYAQNFYTSKQRVVSLTGQAYFKVSHNAARPFIVRTPQMDIRVLGTCFDVSAYPDDPVVSSTLEEGSIALLDKQGKQIGKLIPGEQATFNISKSSLIKAKVKTDDFTSWKTGKLIFKDTGIAEVARKLERRYSCIISVSPDLLEEDPAYTFSIQKESLEEICGLIELSTHVKATINGSHVQLEKIK